MVETYCKQYVCPRSVLLFNLSKEKRKWNSMSTMIFTSSPDFVFADEEFEKDNIWSICLPQYKNGYFEDTHCLMRKKSRSSHRRCSLTKAVKEILQNSHENTFAGVSYLKETPSQVFSWEFCKILRTPPLKNTSGRLLLKSNSFVNIFCSHLSVFPNKSCRIRPIKLKTVMLYQMTNSFW